MTVKMHPRHIFRRRRGGDRGDGQRAIGARALAHAGEDADQKGDRHHRHHDPEHQHAGGAERREELRRDRRLEFGRAAEIALQDAADNRVRTVRCRRRSAAPPCRSRDRCWAASGRRPATGRSGRRSSGGSRSLPASSRCCSSEVRMSSWLIDSLRRLGSRLTMKKTTSVRHSMVSAMVPRRRATKASIARPLPFGLGSSDQVATRTPS